MSDLRRSQHKSSEIECLAGASQVQPVVSMVWRHMEMTSNGARLCRTVGHHDGFSFLLFEKESSKLSGRWMYAAVYTLK